MMISGKTGKTLMEAATASGVDGIAADCGGLMTCATCHVIVMDKFAPLLPPPDDEELAMLAVTASPSEPHSRLGCQIKRTAALDGLAVRLPASQYQAQKSANAHVAASGPVQSVPS
jgi:ferredoxin, 2Fe-2S